MKEIKVFIHMFVCIISGCMSILYFIFSLSDEAIEKLDIIGLLRMSSFLIFVLFIYTFILFLKEVTK